MIYSQTQVDRFWSNVDVGEPDECWPWKRSMVNGYGQVGLRVDSESRILKAHKVAWEIHNNQQLLPRVRASHTCENKLCCNPRHVVVNHGPPGTGLSPAARGEKHGNAKLHENQVRLIKYRLNLLTTREIADAMNVSFHTIWDIRKGITWRHI